MTEFTKEHRETVENLVHDLLLTDEGRTALRALLADRDEAQKNYKFMVDRAGAEHLEGYRELGERAAKAEAEVERLKAALWRLNPDHSALRPIEGGSE